MPHATAPGRGPGDRKRRGARQEKMPHACVTWLRGRSAPPWSWLALLRFQRASQSEVRDSIILRPSSCDWDGRDVVLLKWGLKKIRGACSGCPSKPNLSCSRGPGAGDVSRPQRLAAFAAGRHGHRRLVYAPVGPPIRCPGMTVQCCHSSVDMARGRSSCVRLTQVVRTIIKPPPDY